LILSEDDDHPFLVGITPKGEYYKIGENIGYISELAGCVFSPDGSTLFVNIQHVGLTLAIEGPWIKGQGK
jgi:secreted PhoX family phosphatase